MITSRCNGAFGLRILVLGDEEHNFSQPNHGRASDIKSRLTFDASDERPSEIVEQSTSAIQHALPSGLLRQGVKRVRQTEKHLSVRGLEEDEGYSSPFSKDLKPSQSVSTRASSSPLLSHKTDFHPESLKSRCHDQLPLSWKDDLFAADGLGLIAGGSDLNHVNASVVSVEDHLDGANIGLPLLESSVCDTLRANLNDGSEQNRQGSGEVQEHLEPVHECWTTLAEQDSTLDPSYETTLPLQTKGKSVVVVPGRPTNSAGNPPTQQTGVAQREVDWEREKRMYLDSVKKHISDHQGRRQDVLTELVNLMTGTNCSSGSSCPQPQHPSDFTRRNYQRRSRNLVPSLTLQEWQLKNCATGKRFANVSNHFRSPFSSF